MLSVEGSPALLLLITVYNIAIICLYVVGHIAVATYMYLFY